MCRGQVAKVEKTGKQDTRETTSETPLPVSPELEYKEMRQGHRPGERYVRIIRPHRHQFRKVGPGHLAATEKVLEPKGAIGRLFGSIKRFLIGAPLATSQLAHERLSKIKALAVLSSDALSSSAYATEEILLVLVLAGTGALQLTVPISLAIAALLAIVAASYRQTIHAYPKGGGSYIVAKDNLGTAPALVAGAALLTDYVLTVAVSISSGVAAITSAVPSLYPERVLLGVAFIVLITLINLRGVRESGTIFAAPTYIFILSISAMIGLGLFKMATGAVTPSSPAIETSSVTEPVTIFLILRAFSSGCAALTGTEAISDGVPAFKPPEAKNAATTLTAMAVILGVLFLGISFLAYSFGIVPQHAETVVSQIARITFGDGPAYYFVQIATMLILVLAANTSFADFPRLSYFMARDHFMPHQFSYRGDRLAFSTGIIVLGLVSSLLVIVFHASTHALIPLYAIGVFVSFTLSQSAMVRRWWVRREPGWQRGIVINGIGAATTAIVALVIATTKFALGAWMVLLLIPTIVLTLKAIHSHYQRVADELTVERLDKPIMTLKDPLILVPISNLNLPALQALTYARSLSKNIRAIHVSDEPEEAEQLRRKWDRLATDIPLVILESPYRALAAPLLAYIDAVHQHDSSQPVTVLLAEFVPNHWWEHLLHNQAALRLRIALFFRPNTVVIDFPYRLQ